MCLCDVESNVDQLFENHANKARVLMLRTQCLRIATLLESYSCGEIKYKGLFGCREKVKKMEAENSNSNLYSGQFSPAWII